ncbi:MAG: hypothetical protein ACKV2T_02075 [Kofleriaceae bacterium]
MDCRWLVVVALGACGTDGTGTVDPLPPPPKGEGIQVAFSATAAPGEEVWKCNVTDLPNPGYLEVNHVKSVQNDTMHHMDLMAIALAAPNLAIGEYDCAPLYEEYPSLMEDGITIYAAQQAEQQITLPEGVTASLLPKLRVMHEIHFVNPTDEPVELYSKINAYKYEGDLVTTIWGGAVRDTDITIPANASGHVEWSRCVMNSDVDVMFLSTHTHELARLAEIRRFDGTTTGELVYTNDDWHAPPLKDFTAAPMRVPAGQGFEFSCHFDNPKSVPVNWGFLATDEMCQIAIVFTPGETTRTCEVVESGTR